MHSSHASGARQRRSARPDFFAGVAPARPDRRPRAPALEENAPIALDKAQRINREITAPEVRLVAEDGEQLGIVAVADALRAAEERDVDLVEIAPLANPPVCKLMDYGKYRYREQKKAHEAKLKQKQIQIKEIKFRPRTDEGDYRIKLNKLIEFLEEGDKAKVTLRFRGREMAHQEFGKRVLERVKADLDSIGVVEQFPKMEGRQMVMVIAPKKKAPAGKSKKPPAAKSKPSSGKPAKPVTAA